MWAEIVYGLGLVFIALAVVKGPLSQPWWRLLIIGASSVMAVLAWWLNPWLSAAGLVLLVSSWRLIKHRYGPKRERRVLGRTTSWLALLVALSTLWQLIETRTNLIAVDTLAALSLALLGGRALALSIFRGWQYQYRLPAHQPKEPSATLSLAIPARNETHALTDHLRAAVASSYQKLEVLVLDDCSQDSTPDIVRSFANDGVRFIQGEAPASGWLGKNFAYQTLLGEVSGDWVVFAGVDIRFERDSLVKLLRLAEQADASVLSVMPYRRNFDDWPALARPLRYYWQLAVSPWPFMNSCWLVKRDWLVGQGGLKPYKHSIWPERDLAEVAKKSGGYQFIISTPELGITTRKRANSLFETAKRTLYPLVRRELVWLAAKTLLMLSWLVLPWLDGLNPSAAGLLTFGWGLLWLSYFVSEMILQPRHWFISGWLLPVNLLNEIWLGLVSGYGYEFGQVNWKGRNICLPVLADDQRERSDLSVRDVTVT